MLEEARDVHETTSAHRKNAHNITPQVPIKWEEVDVTPILKNGKTSIPEDAIKSIKKNTVALKGPLATPSQ